MRGRQLWIALVGSALLLGLVVGGCGGGGASNGEGPAADRAEFIRTASAACAAENKKASAQIRRAYGTAKVRGASGEREAIDLEVKIFVPILIDAADADVGRIRALDVPSGDGDEVGAILAAYETWIRKAKGTPFRVVVANDIYNGARALAAKYGLTACAQSPFEGEA